MEAEDRLREARLEHLRSEIRKGLESGSSEAWNAGDVKLEARARKPRGRRPGSLAGKTLDEAFFDPLPEDELPDHER